MRERRLIRYQAKKTKQNIEIYLKKQKQKHFFSSGREKK